MKRTLKVRITAAVVGAVVIVSALVGGVSFSESRRTAFKDSKEILALTNSNQSAQLNQMIAEIEQSVNTLSDMTLAEIEDFDKFKTDSNYVTECTKELEMSVLQLATHTNGAITAYVRYNPEFTEPTSGIFLSKSGDSYEYLTPTDFSMYDPSDVEHVGWYYIPVEAGEPIWMDPYLNENIDTYMISYVIPIYIDGESVGIVGMDIDFNVIQSQIAEMKAFDTGYTYLTNSENSILYHKDYEVGAKAEEVLKKDAAVIADASLEGTVQDMGNYQITYSVLDNGMKLINSVPENELKGEMNRMSNSIMISVFIGLIGCFIYAIFVSNSISKPIKLLTKIIKRTADLDLTPNEGSKQLMKRTDETGDMANAIHQMRSKLREMTKSIDDSCESLYENISSLQQASEAIDNIAESNSALTQELAAGIQESTDATVSMQGSIADVNENAVSIETLAKEGSNLSREIMKRAVALGVTTKDAADKTKEMYTNVKQDTELALQKSKAVQKIGELADAISEISTQTGLLALNASIEAARAGEAGKGFAVVATEITNLSNQTAETVANISDIVKEVNDAVADMAKCLDISMEFMGKSVLSDYENFGNVSEQYKQDASVIENSMNNIDRAITTLTEHIIQIKTAVEGISKTANESSLSINEIAGSTSEMAEKTSNNADMVNDSMQKIDLLKEIVGQFNV